MKEIPKRPKVIVLTPWYPTREHPAFGVFVREHARSVAEFADVTVLHWAGVDAGPGPLWRLEAVNDAELTEGIPTYRLRQRAIPVRGLAYVLFLAGLLWAFRRIVRSGFRPNLVHAHVYSMGVPAILIGRLHGLGVVVTEHASAFGLGILRRADLAKARFAFGRADAVMPVSDSLRRILEGAGIRARFRVVPNVVDTELFHTNGAVRKETRPAHILFVGNLDESHRKGVPHLLEAAARLAAGHHDWHLDIVGDGLAREGYVRRAAELGIADRVTFHGRLQTKDEVARLMRQSAFLVIPAAVETFAVAAAEALASGTPVVTTRCGGPEEYVTAEMGAVVPPGDVEALTRAMADMLERYGEFDPEKLAAYAAAKFSPECVGRQIGSIYREALTERR